MHFVDFSTVILVQMCGLGIVAFKRCWLPWCTLGQGKSPNGKIALEVLTAYRFAKHHLFLNRFCAYNTVLGFLVWHDAVVEGFYHTLMPLQYAFISEYYTVAREN